MIRLNKEQLDGISLKFRKPHLLVKEKSQDNYRPEVSSEIVDTCVNSQLEITGLTSGVIAKVTVILAQFTVQINLQSSVTLPNNFKDVLYIKNKTNLSESYLLQDTNMVFIKGIVKKEINYTVSSKEDNNGEANEIKHCTVNIPFNCTTPVTFNGIEPEIVLDSNTKEYEFHKNNNPIAKKSVYENKILNDSFCEVSRVINESYNEMPYCELVSSKIVEHDKFINSSKISNEIEHNGKDEYRLLEERSILYMTLRILQNRHVSIPPYTIMYDNNK